MTENNSFKLGYDYDAWHGYGQRDILSTDISLKTNSHQTQRHFQTVAA